MTTAFPHPMRLPVISAPMFLVSGPELVIAACKAGIGGAFPTPNCRTVADLDAWMGQITDALTPGDGPWVANLITHSTNARLEEDLRLVAQYKPPIGASTAWPASAPARAVIPATCRPSPSSRRCASSSTAG